MPPIAAAPPLSVLGCAEPLPPCVPGAESCRQAGRSAAAARRSPGHPRRPAAPVPCFLSWPVPPAPASRPRGPSRLCRFRTASIWPFRRLRRAASPLPCDLSPPAGRPAVPLMAASAVPCRAVYRRPDLRGSRPGRPGLRRFGGRLPPPCPAEPSTPGPALTSAAGRHLSHRARRAARARRLPAPAAPVCRPAVGHPPHRPFGPTAGRAPAPGRRPPPAGRPSWARVRRRPPGPRRTPAVLRPYGAVHEGGLPRRGPAAPLAARARPPAVRPAVRRPGYRAAPVPGRPEACAELCGVLPGPAVPRAARRLPTVPETGPPAVPRPAAAPTDFSHRFLGEFQE